MSFPIASTSKSEYNRIIQERDDALSREMAERAARVALQDECAKLRARIAELESAAKYPVSC